jgi:hypothetical protein
VSKGEFFSMKLVFNFKVNFIMRNTKGLKCDRLGETFSELLLEIAESNSVHGALGTSKRRHNS